MIIQVQSGAGEFNLTVVSTDTILDLKKKIEEEEGVGAERQSLYYLGYMITDDRILIEELIKEAQGGTSFNVVFPKAGKPRAVTSDREITLITGSRNKFQTLLLKKKKTMQFKPKKTKIFSSGQTFAIVYNTTGTVIGNRILHALVYEVNVEGTIVIKTEEDEDGSLNFTVTIVNGEEIVQELQGMLHEYDETKNTQEEGTMLDRAERVGTFLRNIARVGDFIAGLVFGGIFLYALRFLLINFFKFLSWNSRRETPEKNF